jgi:2-(1,2-epoxy-1,2-dihydrophenyl)acetyl-CoA isomerase
MVTVERSLEANGVLWLTLNRPDKLNAVNDEMAGLLRDHIDNAAADPAVRCIVLTGRGRAFCAGGDVSGMGRRDGTAAVGRLRGRGRLMTSLAALPQPLIAAVNGPAVGGGFSLALASDLILADPAAFFRPAFIGLGLAPDMGFTYFLARQLGVRRALAVTLDDRRLDAGEALRLGLVTELSPPGELASFAGAFAARLAARSPHALAATKQLLRSSLEHDLSTAMELETYAYGVAVGTDEHRAAVEQFRRERHG